MSSHNVISSRAMQRHLVGFFDLPSIFSWRSTCRGYRVLSFKECIQIMESVIKKDPINAHAINKGMSDDVAERFFRSVALAQIQFEKQTSDLTELSFTGSNLTEEQFLIFAHSNISYPQLQHFSFSVPSSRYKLTRQGLGKWRHRVMWRSVITPEDILAVARKVRGVSSLRIELGLECPEMHLSSFLGAPKGKGDEADRKERAESSDCNFPNLTQLSLYMPNPKLWTVGLIETFKSLPALKSIEVDCYEFPPNFVEIFTKVPKLTRLKVASGDVSILRKIGTTIHTLNLRESRSTLKQFEETFSIPTLTSLTVGDNDAANENSKGFVNAICQRCTSVKELVLFNWFNKDNSWHKFIQMPQLRTLKIKLTLDRLKCEDLVELSKGKLEELYIDRLAYENPGAGTLRSETLKTLIIREHNFSEEAIKEILNGCPNLKDVQITRESDLCEYMLKHA